MITMIGSRMGTEVSVPKNIEIFYQQLRYLHIKPLLNKLFAEERSTDELLLAK
jgi:hypothetical protein